MNMKYLRYYIRWFSFFAKRDAFILIYVVIYL